MSKYAVINPANGETVKEYPQISDDELEAAIAAADDAHRNWALKTSVSERAALVKKVADFHAERREELAEIIVREMGKPMEQALGEVDFCADIYGFYADNARGPPQGRADRAARRRGHGADPALVGRAPGGDHALELPLLPGGPLRRTEPRRRQPDPAEAGAPVPRVGRGDPEDARRRRLPRRAPTRRSSPRTTRSRRRSRIRGSAASR